MYHRHSHRRGGGRQGGTGRRRRPFGQGDLRLIMLHLLSEAPRHGYEIIKLIDDKTGGGYGPSPGVVYPNLTMLEELGYATSSSEGVKRLYAITPEGENFLRQNRAEADAILERLTGMGDAQGRPAPQILRAFDNLQAVLRQRTSRDSLSEEEVFAIVDTLDAAAKSIERGKAGP